jgi:hypothetical protein
MDLRIDHATIAGSDLDRLIDGFAAAGLPPEYGGTHSNDVTHMALLGFPDGAYLELISTVESGAESPLWHAQIQGDAGPCAWAVVVEDVERAAAELRESGIAVEGPVSMARERPDGVRLEWELAFPGGEAPGATLPFLIADRTPRERRVTPTPAVVESELTGIEAVVLGVPELDPAVERFQRAFDCGDAAVEPHAGFGARAARFPDAPVAVVEPLEESWLRDRLDRFGPCPCAILLGTREFDASTDRFGLDEADPWAGRRLGWPGTENEELRWVGVVEAGD